jgi:hypothetical protein
MSFCQGFWALERRHSPWKGGIGGGLCLLTLLLAGCSRSTPSVNRSVPDPATRVLSSNPGGTPDPGAGLGTVLQQLAGELIGESAESPANSAERRPALRIKPRDGAAVDGDARQTKAISPSESARESRDAYSGQTTECQRAFEDFRLAKDAKDTEDSIFYYRRGLRLCPNDEAARNELGELYLKVRQYDEAAQEFKRVLEINPESVRGRTNLETARSRK